MKGKRVYEEEGTKVFAQLGEIVSLYGETSYLLNQLLRSLYKKRLEGTWERTLAEEPAIYQVPSVPSDEEPPL